MVKIDITQKPWFDYLEHDIKELLNESLYLLDVVPNWKDTFHDYSFVVFPASKAFEGFLKRLFLDMGFISKQQYYYKYFRIGKALNPELEKKFRQKESIYDKIVQYCSGVQLADQLWKTWKLCRNNLFHWFPDERTVITFPEARECIMMILQSMDNSFQNCNLSETKEGLHPQSGTFFSKKP
jgi:hypothetical protein